MYEIVTDKKEIAVLQKKSVKWVRESKEIKKRYLIYV